MKMEYLESSRNFSKSELSCKCCGIAKMDPVFLSRLQAMRDHFGKAIGITSGYRCEKHNDAVPNASKNSQHLHGRAVDISISGLTSNDRHELLKASILFGFTGVGFGKNNFHIDLRPGQPKAWGY